jgi:hypothetical protein
MTSPQITLIPVEILAAIPAKVAGQASVVLTVRMNPSSSFMPTHLSVSRIQAERLRADLTSLLAHERDIWAE